MVLLWTPQLCAEHQKSGSKNNDKPAEGVGGGSLISTIHMHFASPHLSSDILNLFLPFKGVICMKLPSSLAICR